MRVHSDLKISDIRSEFSKQFQGLKLEMYKEAHEEGEGSRKSTELQNDMRIGDLNPALKASEYNFDPAMTVAQLESDFKDKFGLYVQVFRRSNDLWLQTSTTDDWTLEKQNTKGLNSIQE